MHLEVLVEEPSAEVALSNLLPRLMPADSTFRLHVYNGKQDLLRRLPNRLLGYSRYLPEDWRVIVLVDRDADDCHELKQRLDRAATQAGLTPRTQTRGAARFHVLNRIAIEELEAWFFGDVVALRAAYPRVAESLDRKQAYRDPDAIRGGTKERLARVLGYGRDTYPEIAVARAVSEHMVPERNRSHSFQVFAAGIAALVAGDA